MSLLLKEQGIRLPSIEDYFREVVLIIYNSISDINITPERELCTEIYYRKPYYEIISNYIRCRICTYVSVNVKKDLMGKILETQICANCANESFVCRHCDNVVKMSYIQQSFEKYNAICGSCKVGHLTFELMHFDTHLISHPQQGFTCCNEHCEYNLLHTLKQRGDMVLTEDEAVPNYFESVLFGMEVEGNSDANDAIMFGEDMVGVDEDGNMDDDF